MLAKLVIASRHCDPEWQHTIVSLTALGVVGERLRKDGFEVHALNIRGPFSLISAIYWIGRRLRQSRPRPIVQTWLYHANLIGGLVARNAGCQALWNIRQTIPAQADMKWSTRFVCRLCAWLSGRVPERIVCCASAIASSHAEIGYSRSRFELIDNGFDTDLMVRSTELRAQVRESWACPDDVVLVGTVGRADPQKDHNNFLEAIAEVTARLPNVRFVLLGRGIDTDEVLKKRIDELLIRDKVMLKGERSDMPAVMSALDVFVLSSRSEGFPNVLGEAMSCELPVVSTEVGAASRIVGSTGTLVPPSNSTELARAIFLTCSATDEQRAFAGKRARERVVNEFSINSVWRRYRDLYSRVLRDR